MLSLICITETVHVVFASTVLYFVFTFALNALPYSSGECLSICFLIRQIMVVAGHPSHKLISIWVFAIIRRSQNRLQHRTATVSVDIFLLQQTVNTNSRWDEKEGLFVKVSSFRNVLPMETKHMEWFMESVIQRRAAVAHLPFGNEGEFISIMKWLVKYILFWIIERTGGGPVPTMTLQWFKLNDQSNYSLNSIDSIMHVDSMETHDKYRKYRLRSVNGSSEASKIEWTGVKYGYSHDESIKAPLFGFY